MEATQNTVPGHRLRAPGQSDFILSFIHIFRVLDVSYVQHVFLYHIVFSGLFPHAWACVCEVKLHWKLLKLFVYIEQFLILCI